jgi:hypothetical protein
MNASLSLRRSYSLPTDDLKRSIEKGPDEKESQRVNKGDEEEQTQSGAYSDHIVRRKLLLELGFDEIRVNVLSNPLSTRYAGGRKRCWMMLCCIVLIAIRGILGLYLFWLKDMVRIEFVDREFGMERTAAYNVFGQKHSREDTSALL